MSDREAKSAKQKAATHHGTMSTQALPRMRDIVHRFARAQRSPRTAKSYGQIVEGFLKSLGHRRTPRRSDVDQFLTRPLKSGAPPSVATRNQELAALRAFAQFAIKEGSWRTDPTGEVRFLREPEREPAVLLVPEVQRFFHAVSEVSPRREHVRDRAILGLCFVLGLRLGEIVRLDISQVDLFTSTLLGVIRKGGRVQNLPLEPGAAELIRRWLEERDARARQDERALFVSTRGTRLSGRTIDRLFERLRKHVGTPKHVTPHTARHSFITIELSLGADISVVSRLAGHASVTTTMHYRHLLDHEPRKAVGLLGAVIPLEILGAAPAASNVPPRATPALDLPGLSSKSANDNQEKDVDDQEDLEDNSCQAHVSGYPHLARTRSLEVMRTWQRKRDRSGRIFHRRDQQCCAEVLGEGARCVTTLSEMELSPCDG